MATSQYTFLPWIRQGIGTEIDEVDDLGAGGAVALTRATIGVQASVKYRAPGSSVDAPDRLSTERTVQVIGPADIVKLKAEAVIRVEPVPYAVDFPITDLAHVELFDEDLPWRYSPAKAQGEKLRPWVALFVLAQGEYEAVPARGELPPVVRIKAGVALPPPDEAWAWAHVQIAKTVTSAAEVEAVLADRPELGLSRVVCPRRLEPGKNYRAFLVPAFETGRRAGLGLQSPGVLAQQGSWDAVVQAARNEYPIYFEWPFQTTADGDFETLARRLSPMVAPEKFGKRPMDVAEPGYGLNGTALISTVELEGALGPTDLARQTFPVHPGTPFTEALEEVLDLSANSALPSFTPAVAHPFGGTDVADDPIVVPPTYGLAHAGVYKLADATSSTVLGWLAELNLDPRNRVPAGLGVQVIQKRQEELMERAWRQLGDLEQANQRRRQAELALEMSSAMFAKHLRGRGANVSERFLILTAATHRGVTSSALAAAPSVRASVRASRVPVAMHAPTLRRLGRPSKSWLRAPGRRAAMESDLVTRANLDRAASPVSAAPPRPDPSHSVTVAAIAASLSQAAGELAAKPRTAGRMFLEIAHEVQRTAVEGGPAIAAVAPLRAALTAELNSRVGAVPDSEEATHELELNGLIAGIQGVVVEGNGGLVTIMFLPADFQAAYGADIESKSYRGVSAASTGGAALPSSRMVDAETLEEYQRALGRANTLMTARPGVTELPPLSSASLVDRLASALRPAKALVDRVLSTMTGARSVRGPTVRLLRSILWHPVFDDAMFADLRDLSNDFIIPNFGDLPKNTLTLLEPNRRFIHSYLAGLNTEFGRELLWRGFPTDQAGTYVSRFWDTTDSASPGADISAMHGWAQALGENGRTDDCIVLVVRGDLLRRFPNTVVYMCPAVVRPDGKRVPAHDLALFPLFHGTIDPDVALLGFAVKDTDARGEDDNPAKPGWFVVFKERPGQVRFGMDQDAPAGGLQTWDDLWWGVANCAPGAHIVLASVPAPAPVNGGGVAWNASAADQAYALFQSPIVLARHAAEMLPDGGME